MNITTVKIINEVTIGYNKRVLSYFDTGFSYWYNGREVSQACYNKERFKRAVEKHCGEYYLSWERNENYDYSMAFKQIELIANAVKEDMRKDKQHGD